MDDTTKAFTITRLANTFADRYPGLSATDQVRGRPALLDYLFGGTASQPPRGADLPVAAINNGKLRFTFVTRTDDTALLHRVTAKADLASGVWTTNGVTEVSSENLPDGMRRRTYEVPVDVPQRYLRIEAETR